MVLISNGIWNLGAQPKWLPSCIYLLKSGFFVRISNCCDYFAHYLGFLPFENWSSKSTDFECFLISLSHFSDLHYIVKDNIGHQTVKSWIYMTTVTIWIPNLSVYCMVKSHLVFNCPVFEWSVLSCHGTSIQKLVAKCQKSWMFALWVSGIRMVTVFTKIKASCLILSHER